MNLPKLYQRKDFPFIQKVISENSFGSIIHAADRLLLSRVMILLAGDENGWHLETHLSNADPMARKIQPGQEVLCSFLGMHGYVSSSWYNHINVSTWNYEEVQVYGTVEVMNSEQLYNHLNELTNMFETGRQCPMTLQRMGQAFVEKEMKGCKGLFIKPTEVLGKQKMSQNRDDENYTRILDGLAASENSEDLALYRVMKGLK